MEFRRSDLLKPYQSGSYTLKSSGNSLSAMTLILIFDLLDHIDISFCPFLFGPVRMPARQGHSGGALAGLTKKD